LCLNLIHLEELQACSLLAKPEREHHSIDRKRAWVVKDQYESEYRYFEPIRVTLWFRFDLRIPM